MKDGRKMDPTEELDFSSEILSDAYDLVDSKPRIAAREAYAAMLHAAHARIAAEGMLVPATHKGVSVIIGDLYRGDAFRAQSELSQAERWKQAGDYGRGTLPTVEDAHEAVDAAQKFCDHLRRDTHTRMAERGAEQPQKVDYPALVNRTKDQPT